MDNDNNNRINLKIQQFHDNFQQLIVDSKLPVGVIFFILKDVLKEIELAFQAGIQIDLEKQKQENEEE